jgi:sigma-B regulation protein RsbU (phosphoserine phosphatase)
MYPKEGPLIPGYDVAWINRSCEETGGDYFDFIPVDGQNLAVVIGDVAGHGIGAALLMATGRANLRALFSLKRGIRDVVTALDALLEEDMDVEKFMTLFVANIDFERHLLTYVNAGHDHPLLFRKADGKVETLPATGLPLGILGRDSQHVPGAVSPLDAGDVLLLTTDGVWEETDTEGNRFGKERLTEVFRRWAGAPAQGIVESIHAEVAAFTRGRDRKDDFTLVAVKRVG